MDNSLYSIVDIEVTEEKEIFQFAIINVDSNFNVTGKHNFLIKPKGELSPFLEKLTGLSNNDLLDKPSFEEVAKTIFEKIENNVLVCHGVVQDYAIIKNMFASCDIDYSPTNFLDTVELTKIYFPMLKSYRLADICSWLTDSNNENRMHQADYDVKITLLLLKKIIEKISLIPKENFGELLKQLTYYSYDIVLFSKKYRVEQNNTSNNNYFYKGLYYKVPDRKLQNKIDTNNIFISSISEENYIDTNFKDKKDISILKKSSEYISLDFIECFKRCVFDKNNKLVLSLYSKLIVWVSETIIGDFNELNIDYTEREILKKVVVSKNSKKIYYEYALGNAISKKNIVTNFDSFIWLLSIDNFKNSNFIFEDRSILGSQIKRLSSSEIYYKDVSKEINMFLNKFNYKDVEELKLNIENILNYIHEMYLLESLELYNEAKNFILQDIDYLISEATKYNYNLIKTIKFLNILKSIVKNNNGYYRFEAMYNAKSIVLKYFENKKEKALVNKINERNVLYLENYSKLKKKVIQTSDYNEFEAELFKDIVITNKKVLLIFDNSKYRELSYSNREKKSNIKYKNYSLYDDFSSVFNDIFKNKNMACICFADKDILKYRGYLNLLFTEVITFKSLEV